MGPISPFISALSANRFLATATAMQNRTLERLATGMRINRGADDPSGLMASEHLRAQLAELDAESRTLTRAEHVAATTDGALSEISDLLVEAEGLAVSAANTAGMSDGEREAYQMQLDSTMQTVHRIASTTRFNGTALLDGSFSMSVGDASVSVDSAIPSNLGQTPGPSGAMYTLADAGSGGPMNLVSGNIELAHQSIRSALSQVTASRGRLGAFVRNTVEPAWNSTRVAFENTAAANSMIRDTDYAAEASNLVRTKILSGASIHALVGARSSGWSALSFAG